ncbi:MAG: hypothetical protein M1840_008536 [Geoglossum simile]|nr:MAG: hypothetical protein M1840_008536 [Geoglossum simile]
MSLCDYSALHQHLLTKHNLRCPVCERLLRSEDGLERHLLAVHCSASSRSQSSVRTEPVESRCIDCNRSFPHARALADHRGVAHSNPCPTCDLPDFMGHKSIKAYKRSTGQSFCRDCDLRSAAATEFRCCDCDRDFIDEASLQRHLATYTHALPSRFYIVCTECDRQFRDERALFQHRASVVHNPLSNIRCAASKRCKKRFSCPSALLHHLESGSCRSKMTREKLNNAVLDMDTDRLISGGALTEGEPDVSRSECPSPSRTGSILYTPDTVARHDLGAFRSGVIGRSGHAPPTSLW